MNADHELVLEAEFLGQKVHGFGAEVGTEPH